MRFCLQQVPVAWFVVACLNASLLGHATQRSTAERAATTSVAALFPNGSTASGVIDVSVFSWAGLSRMLRGCLFTAADRDGIVSAWCKFWNAAVAGARERMPVFVEPVARLYTGNSAAKAAVRLILYSDMHDYKTGPLRHRATERGVLLRHRHRKGATV